MSLSAARQRNSADCARNTLAAAKSVDRGCATVGRLLPGRRERHTARNASAPADATRDAVRRAPRREGSLPVVITYTSSIVDVVCRSWSRYAQVEAPSLPHGATQGHAPPTVPHSDIHRSLATPQRAVPECREGHAARMNGFADCHHSPYRAQRAVQATAVYANKSAVYANKLYDTIRRGATAPTQFEYIPKFAASESQLGKSWIKAPLENFDSSLIARTRL